MASFNGAVCVVSRAGPDSLRVEVGDSTFLLALNECEIVRTGVSVEVISVDSVLILSPNEFEALGLSSRWIATWRPVLIWIGAAVMVVAVLIFGVRFAATPLSRLIPLSTEARWFGSTVADSDPDFKVLLNEIPGTRGIRVSLSDSDEINAFALPGASINVTRGLVCFARSPDELVGIMGHEVGHVLERHILRSVISELGTRFLLVALIGGGVPTSLTNSMISREFSIRDEQEADAFAARSMVAAGLDPHALAEFFERMRIEQPIAFESLFSDHPQTIDRVSFFRTYPERPLAVDARASRARTSAWDRLRRRNCSPVKDSKSSDKTTTEDTSL